MRLDDVEGLIAKGHDIDSLTQAAASSFFNQVFRDGYFHADMHPGNVFVDEAGLLVPIDFGIMGHLAPQDRLFLGRLMIAILDRDYDEVARLHADAGMIGQNVPLHLFSQNIRAVIEPLLGKSIGDVSLGQIMGQILRISKRFDIEVQPQFTLLQKTIVMAEGVARQLNPQADMWELSKPLAAEWVSAQANPEKLLKDAGQQVKRFLMLLPHLLDQLEQSEPSAMRPEPSEKRSMAAFAYGAAFVGIIWALVHNFF